MNPVSIESRTGAGILAIGWDNGQVQELTHRQLREACPCSGCRSARLAGEPVEADAAIRLTGIEPVGHNAVNLLFSDGHAKGIYPFVLLAVLHGIGAPA